MTKFEPWQGIPGRQLSAHQINIIGLAAQGLSNKEIGQRLYLRENTIKTHLYRAYAQTGARNRAHLVAMAMSKGLIPIVEAPEPAALPSAWTEAA